jgi:hypothetical protein
LGHLRGSISKTHFINEANVSEFYDQAKEERRTGQKERDNIFRGSENSNSNSILRHGKGSAL